MLEVVGAEGGEVEYMNSNGERVVMKGGRGALISGHFYLEANDIIEIAVGGMGRNGIPAFTDVTYYGNTITSAGGGGGRTSVVKVNGDGNGDLLIIAGGGGGAGNNYAGEDAETDQCGFFCDSPDECCEGYGGKKGKTDRHITLGSGGSGFKKEGESVCGVFDSAIVNNNFGDFDSGKFGENNKRNGEVEDCNGNNVFAEAGHAYKNGNLGGYQYQQTTFEFSKTSDSKSSQMATGSGSFINGGAGKSAFVLFSCIKQV